MAAGFFTWLPRVLKGLRHPSFAVGPEAHGTLLSPWAAKAHGTLLSPWVAKGHGTLLSLWAPKPTAAFYCRRRY
jgi:hypothetical protein